MADENPRDADWLHPLGFQPEYGMKPLFQHPEFSNYRVNRTSHENRVIYPLEDEWTNALGYLVAWCAAKHRIEIYACCFWMTHHHLDIGHVPSESAMAYAECPRFSDFLHDLHFYIFRLHWVTGWQYGPVMNPLERTDQRPSLDAEQIWWDLVYDTANPVKDGFYPTSAEYPGLCLQPENVTKPVWFVRNSLIDAIRTNDELFKEDRISLKLGIPRPFKHLDPETYQREFRTRLDDYESKVAKPRATAEKANKTLRKRNTGDTVDSTKTRRTKRTHTRPKRPRTRTYNPGVNTKLPALRRKFFQRRSEFWDQHREAVTAIRSGKPKVPFPPGTYWWRRSVEMTCMAEKEPAFWLAQAPWHPT